MSSFLRVFFVGGLISYRALFNWIRPEIYIPTMLGAPLFQIVFFTYLGRYAKTGNGDALPRLGGEVHAGRGGRSDQDGAEARSSCGSRALPHEPSSSG